MNFITLKELKKMVPVASEFKRVPGLKKILEDGIEVIRSKKKPRVANGTYSHRLSGLVYCADCGSRMGFISPEANHSETHYDSDSAFQCGNYRSKSGECVSHYVKTSVLEAAILQAIQAVSKYVLENEDEFIQQLKVVWNEQQTRTANNGYCIIFVMPGQVPAL